MFTQAGIMRKTHYKFVKEGETDVKTEDSEKTEEGKACEITLQRTCKAYTWRTLGTGRKQVQESPLRSLFSFV